ncbi:MAG: cupin domain-containing protein [Gammaproteobacteria bacterium]
MTARPEAKATVQVDTERVRVTEWRFVPGAETGWHRHAYDYVVVPITDGTLLLETLQGNVEAQLRVGQSYAREVGVEHNVINAGAGELAFIEIELKPA